ncbi:MAG: hypothetical protein NVSMB56_09020 [Pyrinomonadaceae bacterium]
MDNFLRAWLVNKNMSLISSAFARNAFVSKLMLSENCIGYIDDKERQNPVIVKRKVFRFLREIRKRAEGRALHEKLKFDREDRGNIPAIKDKSLTSVKNDGYLLLEAKYLDIDENHLKYLKQKFPSDSYFISLHVIKSKNEDDNGEIPVHFVWAKENSKWKIVGIGMECM